MVSYLTMSHFIVMKQQSNNTAGVSGSDLYGGLIDTCEHIGFRLYMYSKTLNFDEIFSVSGEGYSLISSSAIHVCFCNDSKPDCNMQQMNFIAFPGEEIFIPFVTALQHILFRLVESQFSLNNQSMQFESH